MTADYQLELTMKGTADELKSMLGTIGLYTGERSQSFSFVRVGGKEIDLKNVTDAILSEVSSSGSIRVTANGPWGSYGELNDVGLFREMSEVAPKASFVAEISGNGQYEVQNLKCELKDGMLNITTYFEANTELDDEEFSEIVASKLEPLGIMTGEDFEDSQESGETNEYVYDPVAKAYVGKNKPMFVKGLIENANDLIAAGLKAQGLPSDEDSVANLSIEDAYAALGAAIGSEDDEDEEDEDEEDEDDE